jgi:hypothetical protein
LHHAAESYDIGVYFEANGHGTLKASPTVWFTKSVNERRFSSAASRDALLCSAAADRILASVTEPTPIIRTGSSKSWFRTGTRSRRRMPNGGWSNPGSDNRCRLGPTGRGSIAGAGGRFRRGACRSRRRRRSLESTLKRTVTALSSSHPPHSPRSDPPQQNRATHSVPLGGGPLPVQEDGFDEEHVAQGVADGLVHQVRRLVKPEGLQKEIEGLCGAVEGGRSFVRPSGTEDW